MHYWLHTNVLSVCPACVCAAVHTGVHRARVCTACIECSSGCTCLRELRTTDSKRSNTQTLNTKHATRNTQLYLTLRNGGRLQVDVVLAHLRNPSFETLLTYHRSFCPALPSSLHHFFSFSLCIASSLFSLCIASESFLSFFSLHHLFSLACSSRGAHLGARIAPRRDAA